MDVTTTDGFAHEIEFWKEFVKSERFIKNWVEPAQNPEIRANHPDVARCFDAFFYENGNKALKVLDIGSGVLPWIKGILPNMELVYCDPLADQYETIFDYEGRGLWPPVKAFAEALPFQDNSFDIVHCSNALDHTQDPRKALEEMERVCRSGGMILIQGFEDEAIHENWQGLHQWNIHIAQAQPESAEKIKSKHWPHVLAITGGNIYGDGYLHAAPALIYANTSKVQTGPHTERYWFVFCYKNV